jgi:hypothetical protein
MYDIGTVLKKSVDFDNSIFFRLWIQIQRDGYTFDPGGYVEEHNEISVIINGGFYLKERWVFVVSEKLDDSGGNSNESN